MSDDKEKEKRKKSTKLEFKPNESMKDDVMKMLTFPKKKKGEK
jgi:hypothetical protein